MMHGKTISSLRLGTLGARNPPQSPQLATKESTMEEHNVGSKTGERGDPQANLKTGKRGSAPDQKRENGGPPQTENGKRENGCRGTTPWPPLQDYPRDSRQPRDWVHRREPCTAVRHNQSVREATQPCGRRAFAIYYQRHHRADAGSRQESSGLVQAVDHHPHAKLGHAGGDQPDSQRRVCQVGTLPQ